MLVDFIEQESKPIVKSSNLDIKNKIVKDDSTSGIHGFIEFDEAVKY